MTRRSRNLWLAAAAGVLAVLAIFTAAPALFRSEPPPASTATLENIADLNEKAAVEAAAHQKAQSEASAEATDQAISRAEERGKAAAETAIRDLDANDTARQAETREQ